MVIWTYDDIDEQELSEMDEEERLIVLRRVKPQNYED